MEWWKGALIMLMPGFLGLAGYLAGCAGRGRWLTFREWWGSPPKAKPYRQYDKPEAYGLPPYPEGDVAGPCVCGSWPGGPCLRCKIVKRP